MKLHYQIQQDPGFEGITRARECAGNKFASMAKRQTYSSGTPARPISTQENKHGIGLDRKKITPRMGFWYQFSVPV